MNSVEEVNIPWNKLKGKTCLQRSTLGGECLMEVQVLNVTKSGEYAKLRYENQSQGWVRTSRIQLVAVLC